MGDLLIQKTVPAEECERFANALTGRECRCDPSKLYTISVKTHGVTEQPQGEPVALPARKRVDPFCYDQGGNASVGGWNACLDEIAKLGPLYTHADPGEVERLIAQCVEKDALIAEMDRIGSAKLAERDALLEAAYRDGWNDGQEAIEQRYQKTPRTSTEGWDLFKADNTLSASAEPSAPVERLRTDLDETTAVLRELIHVMYLGSPLPDWSFGESSLMTRLRAALERKP